MGRADWQGACQPSAVLTTPLTPPPAPLRASFTMRKQEEFIVGASSIAFDFGQPRLYAAREGVVSTASPAAPCRVSAASYASPRNPTHVMPMPPTDSSV